MNARPERNGITLFLLYRRVNLDPGKNGGEPTIVIFPIRFRARTDPDDGRNL